MIEICVRLGALFDKQIAAANVLLDILGEERRVLTGPTVQPADLKALDARKREQFLHAERLERQRRELCRLAGIGHERGAMDYLINDLAARGQDQLQAALRTRWRCLTQLIDRCREANEINTRIAQSRQRQLLQLLTMLGHHPGIRVTYHPGTLSAFPRD